MAVADAQVMGCYNSSFAICDPSMQETSAGVSEAQLAGVGQSGRHISVLSCGYEPCVAANALAQLMPGECVPCAAATSPSTTATAAAHGWAVMLSNVKWHQPLPAPCAFSCLSQRD